MKVLVMPRDPNPYQRLLYGALERHGFTVRYIGDETRWRPLNLLMLPLVLVWWRLAGYRILHLHWVFRFAPPAAQRVAGLPAFAQAWFLFVLKTAGLLRLRLVWTAHNVLPHEPVFRDDLAARRSLVSASDLVIVHDATTLSALRQIGAEPSTWSVIRHGPFTSLVGSGPRRSAPPGEPRLLFFGQVLPYKGVEELAEALGLLAAPLRVTVAGACRDPRLARRLQRAAAALGGRMVLRLERVPDDELPSLLGSADVLVLPYRHVTTSGSALLGLAFGLPLVVPELPALAELPDAATIRYDGTVEGLAGALDRARRLRAEELAAMSRAARDYAASVSWESVAEQTAAAFHNLL